MSGRTAKAARKAEEEKQKDFITRKDAFLKIVKEASLKYRLDLVGTLHYESNGAFPAITIVDIKDKFGHITPEMQKLMEEKAEEDASKKDDVIR